MAASISTAVPTSLPAAISPRKRKPSRKKKRRRQSPPSNPTTRNPRRKNRKRSLRWQRLQPVPMSYRKPHALLPGVRDEDIRQDLANFAFRVSNFWMRGRPSRDHHDPPGQARARYLHL